MPQRSLYVSRYELSPINYKRLCHFKVFPRDKWRCCICGHRKPLNAHHIVYRSQQGPDRSWNLISLCEWCHKAVHARVVVLLAATGNPNDRVDANVGVIKVFNDPTWKPGTPMKQRG